MTEIEENLEELAEITQTWNKIEAISKKDGLREGISDGKESKFQEYFDIGFKEGFKNGFVLGKYKSRLETHCKENSLEVVEYPLLENTSKGDCVICENAELVECGVTELIKKQTDVSNENIKRLHAVFDKAFDCELPKSLDDM